MKYQSTSRILSVLFHGLIFMAFGALASYFAFFVLPWSFSTNPTRWSTSLFSAPFFLYFELAVIGLVMAILSAIGFYHGVKGVINARDDEPVRKSLTWFIVEGWVVALFWLLQATLLFDCLNASNNNLAFVIIMSVVFTIIFLIATCIPMVRMYGDNKKPEYLLKSLNLGGIIGALTISFCTLLTLIGNWSGSAGTAAQEYANKYFGYLLVATLVIAVVLIVAYIALKKGKKASGYLVSTATLLTGAQLIGYCIMDLLDHENHENISCHYYAMDNAWNGYGFVIMGIVVGSVIVLTSLYLFYAHGQEGKEKINKA